jgi:putative tributyrin esterase
VDVQIVLPDVQPDDYIFEKQKELRLPGLKFQTLYLLHGSYDDGNSWLMNTSVGRYAQEKCLALVLPSAENSNYQEMAHGDEYLSYIAEELPHVLSEMLPLSGAREDTFIAGNSMGGGGAFRCAFTHPDRYRAAASLSGALELGNIASSPHGSRIPLPYRRAVYGDGLKATELLELLDPAKISDLPELLMICGTEDFIFPSNENFYRAGSSKELHLTYKKYPGAHNWDCWDRWIREVLDWLPLKGSPVKE